MVFLKEIKKKKMKRIKKQQKVAFLQANSAQGNQPKRNRPRPTQLSPNPEAHAEPACPRPAPDPDRDPSTSAPPDTCRAIVGPPPAADVMTTQDADATCRATWDAPHLRV